jgi:5-methylcytosine-specific restriction endonuclease McrA
MSALLDDRKARVRAEWEPMFAALPGRPKKGWVGKTPKSKIPGDVQLRILRTWGHTCHITGLKITTENVHFDHVIPLEDGVAEDQLNAEWNLRPAIADAHMQIKTAAENKARAKADRAAKKQLGIKAETKKIENAPMQKAKPQSKATADLEKGKLGEMRLLGGGLARRFANA